MTYKYYAFISYSRKNSKAATYLHRSLEHFRIPVKYVAKENLPGNNKFMRPVFRDRRDLEAGEGSFTADLQQAIANSRYLIVLCSPESADSIWVKEEIKHFLATHDNDYKSIVPVVLQGDPGSNCEKECLPEPLRREEITKRNLPSMIPDPGEKEKSGWENGIIQSASYMLKIDREKIKAAVDAEKLRQVKIYAAIGVMCTIIFALLTAWAFLAERRAAANEAEAKKQQTLAEENAKKAQEQVEISQNTLEFLRTIFQMSDPHKGGNKDIKVLDAINAKLPEIEKLSPWQLKAEVSSCISNILSSFGENDKAFSLALSALELNEKHRPFSGKTAIAYLNIGSIYADLDQYNQALEYYHKNLQLEEQLHPDNPLLRISACRKIGSVYMTLGNYRKALEYLQEVLEIQQQYLAEDHPNVAESYIVIGNIYNSTGEYKKALEYYHKALSIHQKSKDTLGIAADYNNIGMIHGKQGNYQEALKYLIDAADIRNKTWGIEHEQTIATSNNIGMICYLQGNYDKALIYFEGALAASEKKFGKDHSKNAIYCNNVAMVYHAQKKYSAALQYYTRALEIIFRIFGSDHRETAVCYHNIGSLFRDQQKYDTAIDHFTAALQIFQKKLGKNHPDTAQCLYDIGYIYHKQLNYKSALIYYNLALKAWENSLGPKHKTIALTYMTIARVYMAQWDWDNAEKYLQPGIEIAREVFDADHPEIKEAVEAMALVQRMKKMRSNVPGNSTAKQLPEK